MWKSVEFNLTHKNLTTVITLLVIHYWISSLFSKAISLRLCSIEATSEHWKCKHPSILCRGSVQFVFVFETCCAVPPSTRQGNQFQNWFFHSKTTAEPWYKRNSVQRARNVKKKKKRFALCYYFAQLWDITSRWVSALLSE